MGEVVLTLVLEGLFECAKSIRMIVLYLQIYNFL